MLCSGSGCVSCKFGSYWIEGTSPLLPEHWGVKFLPIHPKAAFQPPSSVSVRSLQQARDAYDRAMYAEAWGSEDAIDLYYLAAKRSRRGIATVDYSNPGNLWAFEAAQRLHQQSFGKVLALARTKERIIAGEGIRVRIGGEDVLVPVELANSIWTEKDVSSWSVIGSYGNSYLSRKIRGDGIGVPLVAVRKHCFSPTDKTREFLADDTTFSVTALLDCEEDKIQLIDTLTTRDILCDGKKQNLAHDNSGDIAYSLQFHTDSRLEGFFRPGSSREDSKLIFFEPFQENKIPVVFVHGLLSSPDAWADIFNELRADKKIRERYQFWAFRYSTGEPFVKSAADLRSQLDKVMALYGDENQADHWRQIVLVGHSMGGLVSKLLITESGSQLWDAISNVSFDSLAVEERMKSKLAERLFFSPHPLVSRVVYIATPHQGSVYAGRVLGKIASASVADQDTAYRKILQDNPGAFKENVSRGLPTSIDMLDPNQPFLKVLSQLSVKDCLSTHTIIGNGCFTLSLGRSDGVVNVQSAQQCSSVSTKLISATHNGLLKNAETLQELKRILNDHGESKADSTDRILSSEPLATQSQDSSKPSWKAASVGK